MSNECQSEFKLSKEKVQLIRNCLKDYERCLDKLWWTDSEVDRLQLKIANAIFDKE